MSVLDAASVWRLTPARLPVPAGLAPGLCVPRYPLEELPTGHASPAGSVSPGPVASLSVWIPGTTPCFPFLLSPQVGLRVLFLVKMVFWDRSSCGPLISRRSFKEAMGMMTSPLHPATPKSAVGHSLSVHCVTLSPSTREHT